MSEYVLRVNNKYVMHVYVQMLVQYLRQTQNVMNYVLGKSAADLAANEMMNDWLNAGMAIGDVYRKSNLVKWNKFRNWNFDFSSLFLPYCG